MILTSLSFKLQLKDTQNKVLARDLQIDELKSQIEKQQKDAAQQMDIITNLRARVGELHEASSHIESIQSRGELTISALQHEGKEQAHRILELEGRIRDLTSEREESEQKTQNYQRKYNEIFVQLGGVVSLDEDTPEKLSAKVKYAKQFLHTIVLTMALTVFRCKNVGEALTLSLVAKSDSRDVKWILECTQ